MKTAQTAQTAALKALQTIPGIGPSLASDLLALGYHEVSALRGQDPEHMYQKLCTLRGHAIDRCVLYVFRCSVYYASHRMHDPERLKWWNWKERK